LTGVDKHSDVARPDLKGNGDLFFARMTEFSARFPMQSFMVAMNELSNHDHSRFLTRTNGQVGRTASAGPEAANRGIRKGGLRAAVILQMTWPGAPTLYYGDEAGLCGWTDPDNRRTYPWGKEDKELIRFHKEVIRIHRDYRALQTGSLIYLINESATIGYGRFDENDKIFALISASNEPHKIQVPVWQMEVNDGEFMASIIYSNRDGYDLKARIYEVKDGMVTVDMEPESAIIVKTVKNAY
jgi:alpha-glucosidase